MNSADMLSIVQANLLSPVVLCFFLGCVATLVKSDLKIPESVYSLFTIYLLFALGLKGGVELSHTRFDDVLKPAIATLLLGLITPLTAYFSARNFGKLNVPDASALGAHYGSVSVVTFIAAQSFLASVGVLYEGYLSTLVVLLEAPAILLSLLIARARQSDSFDFSSLRRAAHEILTGRSLLLLMGGLIIGALGGQSGYYKVEPLFGSPFQGVVALFLLEMGIIASKRFRDLKKSGVFILFFGTCIPVLNGAIGALF
ncbi:MAG: hypothetical protein RJB13_2254, partial [Pseudomonadota bacterium]